jgi:Ser/Thr protein kinase RdoA (MazF antagonist)
MKPNSKHLDKIKSLWEVSGNLELVRKVENWIYKTKDSKVYFRLTEPSHRTIEQLKLELDWLLFLTKKEVQAAQLIESNTLNTIEEINIDGDIFLVSAFEKANGIALKSIEDFTEIRMLNWGKTIASLHELTTLYKEPIGGERRPLWSEEENHLQIEGLCKKSDPLFEKANNAIELLRAMKSSDHNFGLIHADLHHGNFFIDENDQLTLIDFDDCHYHWFAYDLAVPMFTLKISLRKESKEKVDQIIKWFLNGYQSAYAQSSVVLKDLNFFIFYRHLIIYYWGVKNLKNENLTMEAQNWIEMAKEYCSKHIQIYKF